MKKYKKFGRTVFILMLALVVMLVPCLNCYAFVATSSATALTALMAITGVTLMNVSNTSVAQNFYRDLSQIATDTSHQMYSNAVTILNFTADYSVKVAQATGEMIEVTGLNLSNAITAFKNYLTYKNINGAYEGLTISNYSNSLNINQMASLNSGVSGSSSYNNVSRYLSNSDIMTTFNSKLSGILLSNTVLHSTKRFYDSGFNAFMSLYPDFNSMRMQNFATLSDMQTGLSNAYNWLTNIFDDYTQSVTFNDIYMDMNESRQKCSVEFISFLVKDGMMNIAFVRNSLGQFVGYSFNGGTTYNSRTWNNFTFTNLPYAYFVATPSGTTIPRIMCVRPVSSNVSSADIRLGYVGQMDFSTWFQGGINTSYANADVFFSDDIAFSSSPVSVARVTGSAVGQDVYGIPDIPDTVISGQYNNTVADKIGAVVSGADVIGLNIPADTSADVYNPSISSLIGSGTLTSDVVIDNTTIATGTDVLTAIDTAVGDVVTTTDTVLDVSVSPDVPITPGFPDVFPGLWDWVDDLVDNSLQWFIFCGNVFNALPGAIKYTFLGGMTGVLAVGVIKKLLF